jgi:antitoxin CcdA
MSAPLYRPDAPKKALNVLVNADLIQGVKDARINISKLVTEAMEKAYREHMARQWLEDNHEALQELNAFYEKHGAFADHMRDHLHEPI